MIGPWDTQSQNCFDRAEEKMWLFYAYFYWQFSMTRLVNRYPFILLSYQNFSSCTNNTFFFGWAGFLENRGVLIFIPGLDFFFRFFYFTQQCTADIVITRVADRNRKESELQTETRTFFWIVSRELGLLFLFFILLAFMFVQRINQGGGQADAVYFRNYYTNSDWR